jgi:hypothetical protein
MLQFEQSILKLGNFYEIIGFEHWNNYNVKVKAEQARLYVADKCDFDEVKINEV